MAKFNPELDPVISNAWVNASQGQKANTALGDLFEGLAGAVKVYRKGQKEDKDKALGMAVSGAADELLADTVPPEGLFENPPPPEQTSGPNRGTPEPIQITRARAEINKWETSFKQGGMSNSVLLMKMTKKLKELQTQFPDSPEIAQMLKNAIASHPANMLREELNALRAEEEKNLSDADKRKKGLLSTYDKYLTDPVVQTQYKKLAGRDFNMNDFDENAFLASVATREYETAEKGRRSTDLALEKGDIELKKTKAMTFATQDAIQLRNDIMFTATNSGQPSARVGWDTLERMATEAMADSKLSPEEEQSISQTANRLELETSLALDHMITSRTKEGVSYSDYITDPADIKKIKDVAMGPLYSLRDALLKSDWTTVAALKRNTEALKAEKENRLLQNTDFAVALETMKTRYGEQATQEALRKAELDPASLDTDPVSKALYQNFLVLLATGESPSELLKQSMKDGSIKEGKQFYGPLQAYIEGLSGPNVTKEKATALTKTIFAESENGILKGLNKKSEDAMWDLYMNKGLIGKIAGTEAGKLAYDWAYRQAGTRLSTLADQIISANQFTDNTVITYNEAKGRFEFAGPAQPGNLTMRIGESTYAIRANDAVTQMNAYLDTLEPLVKANGDSMRLFLDQVFNGRDYRHMIKEGSIWTRLRDTFNAGDHGTGPGGTSTKDSSPSTRTPLPALEPSLPEPRSELPAGGRQSRGDRNNNPGNIEAGPFARRRGATGTDGRFATFGTPEQGINALSDLLGVYQRRHGLNTVRAMIGRWAPPGENDTDAYARRVAQAMGVTPDDPIDLEANPAQRAAMVHAIIRHENGYDPYGAEYIQASIE